MTDCQGVVSRWGSTGVNAYFRRGLRPFLRLPHESESNSIRLEAEENGGPSTGRMSSPGRAFPTRSVTILALCMAVHSFTFVSLFPYVGVMVKSLLKLESTNEAGKKCLPLPVHRQKVHVYVRRLQLYILRYTLYIFFFCSCIPLDRVEP